MRPKNSSNSKNPRKRRSQDDPSSDNESESHVNRRKKLNKVKPSRDDSGSSSSIGHRGATAQNSRKPRQNGNSVPPRHPNPHTSTMGPPSTSANLPPPQNAPPPSTFPPRCAITSKSQLSTSQKVHAFNAVQHCGKKNVVEAYNWQMEKLDEFFHEKQFRGDEEAKEIGKSIAMSDELVKDLLRELRENTLTDFIRGKSASLPGQLEALMSEYQKNNIWTQKVCNEVKEKLGLEMFQVMEFLTMVRTIKPVVKLTQNGRKLLQEQLEDWKRDGKLSALVMFELEEKTKLSRPEIEDWFKQKTGGAKKEEKPTPDPSLDDRENGVESGEEQVADSGVEEIEQKVDNGNGQDLDLEDEQEPPTIYQNYRNQEFDESYEDNRAQLMEAEEYDSRDQQMEPKLDQDLPIQKPEPVEVIILDDSDEEDVEAGIPNQEEGGGAVNEQEEVEDVPNFLHHWYSANPDPTFSQIQEVAQRCKSNGLEIFLFLQTQQNSGFNFRG